MFLKYLFDNSEVNLALEVFLRETVDVLGDDLVSLIIYGSLVFDDLAPGYGDLDFLAVVKDDIPDAIPEERQVEQRMEELLRSIRKKGLSLRDLLEERNKKILIVTLLALLEMSRLGMVRITQSETLGDVLVAAV